MKGWVGGGDGEESEVKIAHPFLYITVHMERAHTCRHKDTTFVCMHVCVFKCVGCNYSGNMKRLL